MATKQTENIRVDALVYALNRIGAHGSVPVRVLMWKQDRDETPISLAIDRVIDYDPNAITNCLTIVTHKLPEQ